MSIMSSGPGASPYHTPATPQNSVGIGFSVPTGPPKIQIPGTPVQLTISARTLIDRDTFSKSDPVCVLYIKEFGSNEFIEVGRTEQVKNNLNPNWDKKFQLDYRFEERQMLKFSIYDWDNASYNLSAHDFLGTLECSLGEIVAAPNKKFVRNLVIPPGFAGKSSTIEIVADEIGSSKEVLHVKVNGIGLDKKDFFGKSDPFIIIKKQLDGGSWSNVHKTEVIKNTLNPSWLPFTIRVPVLIGDNQERKIKFEVFDWNASGSSDLIGEFVTPYAQLIASSKEGNLSFPLINEAKKSKKKYTNSGMLKFEYLRIEEEKSFLDYIQSGVQLHFTVAVDFTASNGDPNHPQSLHFRHPNADNQYSLAIKSVGEIIEDYDSDKLFPAMGFGARLSPNAPVSHEFFLNGNPSNPFCQGVAGILEAYHHTLNTVQLYGPTYFAPIINHVLKFAASYQDGKNYFILLILTDGIICDLDATKEAIINASNYPMSIIIVGVGEEDFSTMEFLDSDGQLLKHNGKVAARDIVQFVELGQFLKGKTDALMNIRTKGELAQSVLAEIPKQLCEAMKKFN